ncbi:MAG: Fe-S cluster assembly protein SufD, partial [Methylococcales bacterium]|nr:Fe-S cluster assembly protein SufD [Methylococcales bacterium]
MNTKLKSDNLSHFRQNARALFSENGFPKTNEEEWRYTNLSALEKKTFKTPSTTERINEALLESHMLENTWVMVFIDGYFSKKYSRLADLNKGLTFTHIEHLLNTEPDKITPYLGAAVRDKEHNFIAYNSAYFTDGFFIKLAPQAIATKALQIIHYAASPESLSATRNIIVAEKASKLEIIETFIGESNSLTAAVNEIFLDENATLTLYKQQAESPNAYHFGGSYCKQQPHSIFNHHNFAFGALIARNDIHTDLETASECSFNGLYLAENRQHIDNHTRINHNKPQGISREFYKGILKDRARGVFQGRVFVAKDAQKTDSAMNNRNLLLSNKAEIDTKPQLEIYADDVKCAHGVTIGQLDKQAIFYLQARGLSMNAAKELLTAAFANEMIEKVPLASLKKQLHLH